MSRPNKCIKDENGKDCWIARSTVVIPIVFKLDEQTGDIYTLVEQRGPAVSHSGEWCCPCGFIDWDESLPEACQREVREETGLELNPEKIVQVLADSDKNSSAQTVDLIYMCWTDQDFDLDKVETREEIMDVRWLKVANVYKSGLFNNKINMTIYKKSIWDCYGPWAFKTHKERIVQLLKMTIKGGKGKIKEVDE